MDAIRADIRSMAFVADRDVLVALAAFAPGAEAREDISKQACAMVEQLRRDAKQSVMELFLGEYGALLHKSCEGRSSPLPRRT